jgi:hypothetical protein
MAAIWYFVKQASGFCTLHQGLYNNPVMKNAAPAIRPAKNKRKKATFMLPFFLGC